MEHVGATSTYALAQALGVDVRNLSECIRAGGFTERRADQLATAAGTWIGAVWPDIYERSLAS